MDLSVVVPLYNEEESLPPLVEWIVRVANAEQYSFEIILVDDGSRDKSWSVIEGLVQQYPMVRGIRFQRNYGKSAALHIGFQASRGDVVITMDADLQDSPDEIPELRRMIVEDGYDLVSGWKKKRYDSVLAKNIPSKVFNFFARMVSGIKLNDFNCGLKAYRGQVVKAIEVYGEMHRYIPIIAKWAGFSKIGEKVVEHRKREHGVTKFGANRFINGFLDLITIVVTQKYLKKPMHFFGTWGTFFALIGAANLLYLAYIRLFMGIWISKRLPAMIFGAVALISGVLLFCTGLLAELLSRNSPYKNHYNIAEEIGESGELKVKSGGVNS